MEEDASDVKILIFKKKRRSILPLLLTLLSDSEEETDPVPRTCIKNYFEVVVPAYPDTSKCPHDNLLLGTYLTVELYPSL